MTWFEDKKFWTFFQIWATVGCLQTPCTGGKPGSNSEKSFIFQFLLSNHIFWAAMQSSNSIFLNFTPAYPLYMGSEDTPLWAKFGKMFENFCRQTRLCYTFLESKFTAHSENHNVLERKTHSNPIFHDKHSMGYFWYFCL